MKNEKFTTVMRKAESMTKTRFIEDVKFIYTNCDKESLDNGDFDRLCETLGFDEENATNRSINSLVLSELVKYKDNLQWAICDIVDRIIDSNETIDQHDYNMLCLKMLSIVATKRDIINLYSHIISKLNFDQIKAIQDQLNR